ncbi:MAG: hypothetical protein JXX28_11280 [Deltaproteobacteria bacterium]|nr:hypothetical protein [Deltaproteobacteria bacterium]
MNYPLRLNFKILGLAPQIFLRDAAGEDVFYVKQKLFKLKEAVQVFKDKSRADLRYTIGADRILDFSAKYQIADASGEALGAVKRQGMRSIFRATYEVFDEDGAQVLLISEESVMKRMLDRLAGEVPLLGFVLVMLINPTYLVKRGDEVVMKLVKKPAFFEGKFEVEQVVPLSEREEKRAVLSLLMMSLLERSRG